jgi:hypothetical protein
MWILQSYRARLQLSELKNRLNKIASLCLVRCLATSCSFLIVSLGNKSLWSQRMSTPYSVLPGLGTTRTISSLLVGFSVKSYIHPSLGSELDNWLLGVHTSHANLWETFTELNHDSLWYSLCLCHK